MKNEKGEIAVGVLLLLTFIIGGLGVVIFRDNSKEIEVMNKQYRIAECVKETPEERLTDEQFKECEESAKKEELPK